MKRCFMFLIVLVMLIGVSACRSAAKSTPSPEAPTVKPSPTVVNAETAVPKSTTAPSPTPNPSLPPSTLFDTAWNDREPFRAGLIDSEQTILEQLPDASMYHLDLHLNETMTTVNGRLEVHYTNQENVALDTIYFHLYPNLLSGSLTIADLTVNGKPVPPGYEYDKTILAVPLASSLAPGGQIVVSMSLETAVPTSLDRNYGVIAYVDNVLALAHFYPVISTYDNVGWNIEPAPENGDVTYADISFFLVRTTAPANQVIVASGSEIDRTTNGDLQTIIFAAGPMRDFYLAASPDYQAVTAIVGQTTINSYATIGLDTGAATILDTASKALEIYGNRFGPYPFTEMDLVNTPNLALGIEYPGMMAITSRIYDPEAFLGSVPNSAYIEGTTAHEVGHQWFYSVVGNDQLDEPWLDESITQYITWLYFQDRYGDAAAEGFYQSFQDRWDRIDQADIPIGLPVGAYGGAEYSGIIYGRGPMFVHELAQAMGQNNFDLFLREYYASNKWGIVDTDSFKTSAETHCNCDLNSLFEEWVYD